MTEGSGSDRQGFGAHKATGEADVGIGVGQTECGHKMNKAWRLEETQSKTRITGQTGISA